MSIIGKTFSENLKRFRKQQGISQKKLAEQTSISQRMLAHYENHAAYPPFAKIEVIAKTLGVSVSDILGLDSNSDSLDTSFDIRTLRRFKMLLLLSRKDRSHVYRTIELLLNKPEYSNLLNEIEELKR